MRRRRRQYARPEPDGPLVNDAIRARRVVVVDAEGKKLGEFLTPDAVQFAHDQGMDLIEVSAQARPQVCRLGDWGKMKYERSKAEARSRRRSSQPSMKEVKVRPKTDDHDIAVKTRSAERFLDRGDRVKITVWFRGREHAHHDIGAEQCMRIFEGVKDLAKIERPPHMEGRRMHMILAPA